MIQGKTAASRQPSERANRQLGSLAVGCGAARLDKDLVRRLAMQPNAASINPMKVSDETGSANNNLNVTPTSA